MHICHVITRLIIGGAQENTLLSCRGLAEKGHRVTLIAGPETGPEGSLWDEAERGPYETIRLESLRRRIAPIDDVRAAVALAKLFRRLRPDVVHTHSSKAGILGRWAAARARVPCVIHTIHGMSFNRTQPAPVRALYRFLERRAARWTCRFVTVADAMIDQAVAARIAPRERFVTIRSGMETDRFAPDPQARRRVRQAWGLSDDHVVVGTVARLFRNKGYEEILDALPRIARENPHVRFVWVGNGKDRRRYEARLRSLGLRERVILTGLVPPAE
ncbi:MAG: glycosyltransferase, partial [Planctomycetota bacterium]